MNLYKLHSSPDQLIGFKQAKDVVPELVWDVLRKGKKLNPIQIKTVASNAKTALEYAKVRGSGRWPPGEAAIATNAEKSYFYANDVLESRFLKGEAVIAKDPNYAYYYAFDIIKGRWLPGEKAIATEPFAAYNYATEIIGDRWLEGEKAIKGSEWEIDYKEFLSQL
jgi:hypothetical protein